MLIGILVLHSLACSGTDIESSYGIANGFFVR